MREKFLKGLENGHICLQIVRKPVGFPVFIKKFSKVLTIS